MREEYAAYWAAKDAVFAEARAVIDEAAGRVHFTPQELGAVVAPVIDLALIPSPTYGFLSAGLATPATSDGLRLARGTPCVYDYGEQEQCPGGPGENIVSVTLPGARGRLTIPYDLRWPFESGLALSVFVPADDPVLNDPLRLDAIAARVQAIVRDAPEVARTAPHARAG